MQQICNAPFSYTNPHLITIASKIKTNLFTFALSDT